MGKFVRGDVVVVPFPFSDLSVVSKKRPALVLAPLNGDDVILCAITSKDRNDEHSVGLVESDFVSGKLDIDSVIRPNKLFTAESKIIINKKGSVKTVKMSEVVTKIVNIIS